MTDSSDQRFFFVHVMKTGGTSFADLLRKNFSDEQRYPDVMISPGAGLARRIEAYTFVPRVVEDVNANHARLRMVRGHVPYAVRQLLNGTYVAMTILRHPVDRTLSYLNHSRRYHTEHGKSSIEEIYEQRWFFETFIHNYQTKLLSMTPDEAMAETRLGDMSPPLPPRSAFKEGAPPPPEAHSLLNAQAARLTLELFSPSTGVIEADARRLATAKSNLAEIELVGVTEEYERFLSRLRDRYGWNIDGITHRNAGEVTRVPTEFRKRIADDNQLDMDLYEMARGLAT